MMEIYCRVDVTDQCQVKKLTGEESQFDLDYEDAHRSPGLRSLGVLSPEKISLLLKVIFNHLSLLTLEIIMIFPLH